MFQIGKVKSREYANILEVQTGTISRILAGIDSELVERNPKNKKVVGVDSEWIEKDLVRRGYGYIYERGGIHISQNNVGGSCKTTTALTLACSARRLTSSDKAIVMIDLDPQAVLTLIVTGQKLDDVDDNLILCDYLKNDCELDECIEEVGENMWLLGSSLGNARIDGAFDKPIDLKNKMKNLFNEIFLKFGKETQIFIDFPPALQKCLMSTTAGMVQIDHINRNMMLPMRLDLASASGAKRSLRELNEVMEAFGLEDNIDKHVFFSKLDKREKDWAVTLGEITQDEELKKYISPKYISYCMHIAESTNKNQNIYTSGKKTTAGQDYTDLWLHINGFDKDKRIH